MKGFASLIVLLLLALAAAAVPASLGQGNGASDLSLYAVAAFAAVLVGGGLFLRRRQT